MEPATSTGCRLESPPKGPLGNTERARRVYVEAAGPRVVHERVADAGGAVVDRERLDPVVIAIQRVARPHFHELEREREPPEDTAQALHQLA